MEKNIITLEPGQKKNAKAKHAVNSVALNNSRLEQKEWMALIVLMIVSSTLRLHTNFCTEFIPGNNGAFYLVMIRDLLEKGNLVMNDFPLLFWLEAAIAFVPYKLGIAGMNASIDMTSRIFDSIIPVLSIIPAYLLVKKIIVNKKDFIPTVVFASVSILYFSFLILISDFQKNSLGLLWLFWLIYSLFRIHEQPNMKNYTFLFFILSGLTHYGCFAVAITVVVLDILVRYSLRVNLKKFIKALFVSIIIISAYVVLVFLIDKWRAIKLIEIPKKIFESPIIIPLLKGEPVLSPFEIFNMFLVNLVSVASLIVYLINYKIVDPPIRSFMLSMIMLSLFLSSPFLSIDSALRLYFISYLTAIPLIPFLYNFISIKRNKYVYVGLVVFIVFFSVVSLKGTKQQSNMSKGVYAEMIKLQNIVTEEPRTVIVARHGMEFWSMWIFRVEAIRQETITKYFWRDYVNVYFLIQKKEIAQFGPAGLFGHPYPQPVVPTGSVPVFSDSYFDLYKSVRPPNDFSIFQPKRY
jgi:hypothetical protein